MYKINVFSLWTILNWIADRSLILIFNIALEDITTIMYVELLQFIIWLERIDLIIIIIIIRRIHFQRILVYETLILIKKINAWKYPFFFVILAFIFFNWFNKENIIP